MGVSVPKSGILYTSLMRDAIPKASLPEKTGIILKSKALSGLISSSSLTPVVFLRSIIKPILLSTNGLLLRSLAT